VRGALVALAATIVLAPAASAATPDQVGSWGAVMDLGLPAAHEVVMHNGKVLFWTDTQARTWDPASGQVSAVPYPFPGSANYHAAAQVVLPDGRVMAIGGQADPLHGGITSTAVFDPATLQWSPAADLLYSRANPTATALPDGRVLVAYGQDLNGGNVAVPEVYDPASNSWTALRSAGRTQDSYAFDFVLPSGSIFNAAPAAATGLLGLVSGTWTPGPVSGWQTVGNSESAAMYRPGKIIRSGGTTPDLAATSTGTPRTAVIDMTSAAPAWTETAPMAFARRRHNLVILADGEVMAVGGTAQGDDASQAVLAGEIWNPATQQWTTVASMSEPRMFHSAAVLLPDGRVLAAGGEPTTAGPVTTRHGQVYSPPYLFKGPRPAIAAAPDHVDYGAPFTISTPDAAGIATVALIRPSAVIHGNNMDQRYVPLAFTAGDGTLTATAPPDGATAPPGWYMLVIDSAAGVPSVASWIQVGTNATPPSGTGPGPGIQKPRPVPVSRTRLVVPRRVSLRTIRRQHGLRITVRLAGRPRVVQARLVRPPRRTIATTVRSPRGRATVRLLLGGRALRRGLRPGRYLVQVRVGSSARRLGRPVQVRIAVVR
jgi:hypothetical protein